MTWRETRFFQFEFVIRLERNRANIDVVVVIVWPHAVIFSELCSSIRYLSTKPSTHLANPVDGPALGLYCRLESDQRTFAMAAFEFNLSGHWSITLLGHTPVQ